MNERATTASLAREIKQAKLNECVNGKLGNLLQYSVNELRLVPYGRTFIKGALIYQHALWRRWRQWWWWFCLARTVEGHLFLLLRRLFVANCLLSVLQSLSTCVAKSWSCLCLLSVYVNREVLVSVLTNCMSLVRRHLNDDSYRRSWRERNYLCHLCCCYRSAIAATIVRSADWNAHIGLTSAFADSPATSLQAERPRQRERRTAAS